MYSPSDAILKSISALTRKYGFAPTVREIAEASGLGLGNTHRYLEKLRESGQIEWTPRTSRTIRIVKETRS
ncbi:LexA family protein [Cohnella sp. GCM10020058]|uniref:LexA family protein n=1 Tax=Cohnella sp. GCM10020058 TaxID=3317330 RepID=UPI00362B7695